MNGNPFFVRPADYSQAFGNLSQGLSNLQQQQQLKAQQSQQQQMTTDIQDAVNSGDLNRIADMSIQYPEMAQNIKNAVGFKNEATEENFKNTAFKILSDPENTEKYLVERAEVVKQQGGDPSQTLKEIEAFKANPQRFLQTTEGVAASMYGQDYKNWYDSMNRTDPNAPKPMTEYQSEMVRQKDAEMGIRKAELENKKLESQLKRETDQLKRQEVEQKIASNKVKQSEAKVADQQRISDGIYTAEQNKASISDLLKNDDYIDSLTGYTGRAPALTDTGVEAQAYLDNIKNSMTIDNLKVMSGPLTDKDIQIIASASSRLREGMSKKALQSELMKIDNAYSRVIENYQKELKRKGYSNQESEFPNAPKVGFIESGYEYLGGDPAKPESWRLK